MRILFYADGRSPTARNWISRLLELGLEVHLVSSFSCEVDPRMASFQVVEVGLSGLKRAASPPSSAGNGALRVERDSLRKASLWGAGAVKLRTRLRQWLAPLTLAGAAGQLGELAARLQPDLVHAMRIPYEGMAAAQAILKAPLLISVWGNDFTLHAPATPWLRRHTRQALRRASGLHADCRRDVHLAHSWGFPAQRPAIVLPGAGGIRLDLFHPLEDGEPPVDAQGTPIAGETVINPRGFRAYVCNESFFKAIPLVLESRPGARFVCPAMAGEPMVGKWVAELGIASRVELLPPQAQAQMAALYRRSAVMVSLTTHDGTPNSLLEAMASGCLPVAGDLESLREWITPGVNGLLVDPREPEQIAQAILLALENPELQRRAREHNARLIAERAETGRVMEKAINFYQALVASSLTH